MARDPSEGAAGTVLVLFDAVLRSHPERRAVSDGASAMSFADLERASNQLARYLVAQGARAGDTVAFCGRPGLDSVIALLAAMKSGAAYLPLDDGDPPARIERMLVEAGTRIILSSDSPAPAAGGARPISLSGVRGLIARGDPEPLRIPIRPDDVAYVIFTSGSSGQPKGVDITHGNLAALARFLQTSFALRPDDRVLHIASLGFDASIWETALGLLCGGSLECVARAGRTPEEIAGEIEARAVTVATFTPSYLDLLPPDRLSGIRTLITAGEACAPATVRRWAQDRLFINAYGPAEATVCATVQVCDPDLNGAPPIGRPITGARVHILDDAMQPVPAGTEGEICIGGESVGRGYRHAPRLTAERYVPDPFGPAGSRLYRSGDTGRVLPDSSIAFTGRIDREVKIRGVRTSLPAIEQALSALARVERCVVLHSAKDGREPMLHAFIMLSATADEDDATGEEDVLIEQWRRTLAEELPEHMLPSCFHIVTGFPTLASGKLDMEALRRATFADVGEKADEAPRGPTERMVADIWCRHLEVAVVRRTDHFLELGGHSLVAVRVIAELRETLSRKVPVRLLFANPKLMDFAAAIDALIAEANQSATQAVG